MEYQIILLENGATNIIFQERKKILKSTLMNNGQKFEFKSQVSIKAMVVGSSPTRGAKPRLAEVVPSRTSQKSI